MRDVTDEAQILRFSVCISLKSLLIDAGQENMLPLEYNCEGLPTMLHIWYFVCIVAPFQMIWWCFSEFLLSIRTCIWMNNFEMDNETILQRLSLGLLWENKTHRPKSSAECCETKTKVIGLANHKEHMQSSHPIKTRSKCVWEKCLQVRFDWFRFYFRFNDKMARVLYLSHKIRPKQMRITFNTWSENGSKWIVN